MDGLRELNELVFYPLKAWGCKPDSVSLTENHFNACLKALGYAKTVNEFSYQTFFGKVKIVRGSEGVPSHTRRNI